ncbi:MAG: fibronectin type III domain-containing protein, partial [Bacteroidota bacterium]
CSATVPMMTMNYMDYTYDACKNMFTQGQAARMNALFANGGARVSLLSSQGCVPVSTTCSVPSGMNTTAITTTSATLNWTAVPGAVSYNIRYRVLGTATWLTATSTINSRAISGLTLSTSYEWQVQTVCASTTSAYSASSTFTTPATYTCGTATGLTATNITSTSAFLSWSAVGNVTNYNVQYRIAGTSTWTIAGTTINSYTLSGLIAATSYEWRILTVCSGGSYTYSPTAAFNTLSIGACGLPASLTTSSITASSAVFSWAAVSGAVSYNIRYRSVGSSTWQNVTSTTNSRTVTGLTASTNYEWQVQAVCSGSASSYTSSRTFTTLASISCGTPTGLTVTNITSSSAILNWTAVNGATGYIIYYKPTSSSTWISTSASTNSKTIAGLLAATPYHWAVYTTCSGVNSGWSSVISFTTGSGTCTAATGLSAALLNSTTVQLSWNAVSGATSYTLQYWPTGNFTYVWTQSGITLTTFQISNLPGGTDFQWRILALCSGGQTAFSATSTFATTGTQTCGTPGSLNTLSITSASAILNSMPVLGAVSYNFRYRVVGTSNWTTINNGIPQYNLTGLTPATNYEWEIQSVCQSTTSAYSYTSTFTTAGAGTCSIPTGLTTTNITATSATLSWSAVAGATSYVLYSREAGGNWASSYVNTTSKTIATVSSTGYQWMVYTICSGGTSSAPSPVNTFTTLTSGTCAVPTGLTTTNITSTGARISWNAVSGATGYGLKYKKANPGHVSWTQSYTTGTSWNISSLSAATSYEWKVYASCSGGSSATTAPVVFNTTGATSCQVLSASMLSSILSTSIMFHWGPSPSPATSYILEYRQIGNSNWISIPTTGTYYLVTGLIPGATYEYRYQAVCNGTLSPYHGPYSFTAQDPCPIPSTNGTSNITSSSATIRWLAVGMASSYNYQWRSTSATSWQTGNTTALSTNISGLMAGTPYSFQVASVCTTGANSNYSNLSSFTTPGTPVCQVPMTLYSNGVTSTTATLTWGSVTNASSYNFRYRLVGSSTWITTNITTAYKSLSGLSAGTYEWQVQTVCSTGATSAYSYVANFSTNGTAACRTPESIYYTIGNTSAYITWGSVSGATGYTVRWRLIGASTWNTASVSYYWHTIPGITAGTAYEMQVQTTCSGGTTSAFSNSIYFTTVLNLTLPPVDETRSVTDIQDTISQDLPMKLYPNPAIDELTIEFTALKEGNAKVRVYNLQGQIIRNDSYMAVEGTNAYVINTNQLSSGLYLLELDNSGGIQRKTFAISR